MSEADLLRAIMEALSLIAKPIRLNSGVVPMFDARGKRRMFRGCEAGTPDVLVMLRDGRVVWLEVKIPKGTLTPAQKLWHKRARDFGHTVHVVRDVQSAVDAVREAMG